MNETIDVLMMVILTSDQIDKLTRQLNHEKFYFTRVESGGGFIQRPSVSLLVGINHTRTEDLLQIIRSSCQRRMTYVPARIDALMPQSQPVMIEAEIGGAVVFAFEVQQFVQL